MPPAAAPHRAGALVVAPAQAPRPLRHARSGGACTSGAAVRRSAPGASASRSADEAATAAVRFAGAAVAGVHARGARCVCQANRRAEFRRWHVDDAKVYDAPGDEYTHLGDVWGVRQGRKYAVDVSRGAGNLVRVQLEHDNGSIASVYPYGANLFSWKLKNSSEVLYARPGDPLELDGVRPLKGGNPIYFPQFGPGDSNSPGSVPGQVPMQMHGFARNMEWEIIKTGLTDLEKWPYVRLRLRDTPYSRSMWDHAFELEYEVTLGERHVIMRLTVRNTGDSDFAFTTALNTCIAVHDIRFPQRSFYRGVYGSYCVDKLAEERRVKKEIQDMYSITGPVDKVYLDSQPRLAVEVGTRCTVYVENSEGFSDHIVWHPWTANSHYTNFMCVGSGAVGRPIRLAPSEEWAGESTLFVRDVHTGRYMQRDDGRKFDPSYDSATPWRQN